MSAVGLRGPGLARLLACVALVATTLVLCGSAPAWAGPAWSIVSQSNSTVAPGGTIDFYVSVANVGDSLTDGSAYTVTANLPPGIVGVNGSGGGLSCTAGASTVVCAGTDLLGVLATRIVTITATVDPGIEGVHTATFEAAGGGAATAATTADPVTVTTALPAFGIDAFDGAVSADAMGTSLTQAGGHPYSVSTSIDFNTATDPSPVVGPLRAVEALKDLVVDLPPGFVGDTTGPSRCTVPELANTNLTEPHPNCPSTSQVGTTLIRHAAGVFGPLPVFNMVPPPGVPARFGFNVFGVVVLLDASVRSGGDYGLTVRLSNASEAIGINGSTLELWGVPSDPSHDSQRACPGQPNPADRGPTCQSGAPRQAFFRNPTSCTDPGVGLLTTARIDSWENPGVFKQASFMSHFPPGYPFARVDWGVQVGTSGCESVPFDPVFAGGPVGGLVAGVPAGFSFDLSLPQSDDPSSVGESDLRTAVVTLPVGVRVSPSSADGLAGCSLAQIGLRTDRVPSCPDGSRIGSVVIDTPLLDEQVRGGVYLAAPFANPFHSLVAVYLVASARGVVLKLPGRVSLDPVTGQITTTFDENPQLPFSRLDLELKGGPRAPLTLPDRCGTYTSHAVLTGWNGSTVSSKSSFTLSENARGASCPSTFSPGFSAGTVSNRGGSSSSFLLRFTRADADQELKGLSVRLARGLTAKIRGVALCGEQRAAAGSCLAGSRVGDVTVGAGAGSNPFFITSGRAYLTGPYKGAPFGLSIVVPAVAGPFDLGDVVVRSALFVDKHTASVRVVSDPLPRILQGIPLDVRDVRVDVNRPRFFRNPTSCAVKRIRATLTSVQGRVAKASTRFQAAECASLRFKPKMVLRVGGSGHTRRGQASAFSTTLRMPPHSANLRFVKVVLPKTINARLNTINDACTREEFESDIARCAHARAGTARALTPLLRHALKGNVYFVKNGHPIPDLFVALRGQVDFDLIGRITIPGGTRLATTFKAAPDVPVRSFSLRLLGGAHTASIGAAANLCSKTSRRQKARVAFTAQNGTVRQLAQPLTIAGCKRKHRAGRGR